MMDSRSFELRPTLAGELITLHPLRPQDFEALYKCAADPLIWAQHPHSNRYHRDVFQGFFDSALRSGGAFAVIENVSGELIGSSRYYDLQIASDQVAIGYTFLQRKYWGGRYNREMKSLMLAHAFRFVSKVNFEIGERNLRSRKAIERIGAKVLRNENLDGHPHVVYRIGKAAFTF